MQDQNDLLGAFQGHNLEEKPNNDDDGFGDFGDFNESAKEQTDLSTSKRQSNIQTDEPVIENVPYESN